MDCARIFRTAGEFRGPARARPPHSVRENQPFEFFANPVTLDRPVHANRKITIDLNGFFIEFSKLTTIPKESAEAMTHPFALLEKFVAPFVAIVHARIAPRSRVALLILLGAAGAVHAADNAADKVRYVRDWIAVPLLASAAPDARTLHNGLVSGTQLTLLESNDSTGLSHVRTRDGLEGWVGTRYLSAEPIARVQLEQANAELENLRKLKAQLDALPPDIRTATQQLTDLRSDNTRLQQELSDAQKTPSEAAEISADNTRLKAANADLQQQLQARDVELGLLRNSDRFQQFREGALAVIAGALLVAIVRRLWPKKRSEWS